MLPTRILIESDCVCVYTTCSICTTGSTIGTSSVVHTHMLSCYIVVCHVCHVKYTRVCVYTCVYHTHTLQQINLIWVIKNSTSGTSSSTINNEQRGRKIHWYSNRGRKKWGWKCWKRWKRWKCWKCWKRWK